MAMQVFTSMLRLRDSLRPEMQSAATGVSFFSLNWPSHSHFVQCVFDGNYFARYLISVAVLALLLLLGAIVAPFFGSRFFSAGILVFNFTYVPVVMAIVGLFVCDDRLYPPGAPGHRGSSRSAPSV